MGFFDILKGKKAEETEHKEEKKEKQKPAEKEIPEGKYDEPCSVCGATGTDKKWLGQYFHTKCLRKMKKAAKGMI